MNDNLLYDYIDGKLGKRERKEVLKWIHSSKENARLYAEIKASHVFSTMPDITIEKKGKNGFRTVVTRIAAALLLPVAALGLWAYASQQKDLKAYSEFYEGVIRRNGQNPGMVEYKVNTGVKGKVMLPDSSVVWLNSATTLICPTVFDSDKREVTLIGEGYFDVRSNPEWPMYIKTAKGFTAKITGTTFNLSAYDNDEELKLTLISGHVTLLEDTSHQEIEVKPLDEIKLREAPSSNSSRPRFSGERRTANIYNNTAWKDGVLIFDDTPMDEVIKKIERWYGVSINSLNPKIKDYRFTANFSSESLDRVMELLKISSFINYKIEGKNVTLF